MSTLLFGLRTVIYPAPDLEAAIVENVQHFLLELGKGFLFEARQKRFTFDEEALRPYFPLDRVIEGVFKKPVSADQIPLRAVEEGLLSRFGQLDSTDGGVTQRYSLSGSYRRIGGSSSQFVFYLFCLFCFVVLLFVVI